LPQTAVEGAAATEYSISRVIWACEELRTVEAFSTQPVEQWFFHLSR